MRLQTNRYHTLLMTGVLSFILLVTTCLPPFTPSAEAWKPRTHVYLADVVRDDIIDNGKVTMYLVDYNRGEVVNVLGEYAVDEALVSALRNHRGQFFAGTIGPDAYPDLITGQQAVHPDNDDEKTARAEGTIANQWLEHVWRASRALNYNTGPIQAFVAGFLTHAAGDAFGHTFINHFTGDAFEFSGCEADPLHCNAVKHVVLEGYVDLRTPHPSSYDISIDGVTGFIYEQMVDAKPGSALHSLLQGEGTAFSAPRVFSEIRYGLAKDVEEYNQKLANYRRLADDAQREAARFEQRVSEKANQINYLAQCLSSFSRAYDCLSDIGKKAGSCLLDPLKCVRSAKSDAERELGNLSDQLKAARNRLTQHSRDYDIFVRDNELTVAYKRCWIEDIDEGLREWPHFSHRIAQALTFKKPGSNASLSEIASQYTKQYPATIADDSSRNSLSEIASQYTKQYLLPMTGLPDGNCGLLKKFTQENIYTVSSKVVNVAAPPQVQAEIERMKQDLINYLLQEAMSLTLDELKAYILTPENYFDRVMGGGAGVRTNLENFNTQVLRITDTGYANRAETYDWYRFPAAFNTVVMTKLLFMKPTEVRRLMRDLRSPGADDETAWRNFPNAMIGFMRSLDADNQWCNNPNMIIARDPFAYVRIFMRQEGQKSLGNCARFAQAAEQLAVRPRGIVTTGALNVRSGPGTGHAVLGTLQAGQQVEVIGMNGKWWQILFTHSNGRSGWVSGDYMEVGNTDRVPNVTAVIQSAPTPSDTTIPLPENRPGPSAGLSQIVFRHSGKCVRTTDGQSDTSPIQLEQASCRPEYRFQTETVPGNPEYVYIKYTHRNGAIGCMSVPDIVRRPFGNGAVWVKPCAPQPEYMWRIVPVPGQGGNFNLIKPRGDEGFCLGVENQESYYGQPEARSTEKRIITVNYCANDPWQMVRLVP